MLMTLLLALGQQHQINIADDLCARFRKEEGVMAQVLGSVSDAVGSTASGAGEAVSSALSWMRSKLPSQPEVEREKDDPGFHESVQEQTLSEILKRMDMLDQQLAAGGISPSDYEKSCSALRERLMVITG